MHPITQRFALVTVALIIIAGSARAGDVFVQTNLVSDISGMAQQTDPNLLNPWGLSFSTGSPFWISDQASNVNGSQVTTLYKVPGSQAGTTVSLPVPLASFGIRNQGGSPPDPTNGPTGQVNTSAPGITTGPTDFPVNGTGAKFIFANMDGSISGWNGGAHSTIEATVAGASFTGLAIGNTSTGAAQIYAADQHSGNVLVFNSQWAMAGKLTDPNGLPAGYSAFNVQNLGGKLYVTFANQATSGGIVDTFTTDGKFIARVIDDQSGIFLSSPWGLAIAPKGFGLLGGDLLVGNNNGPNWINAYTLSGTWLETLTLNNGQPFAENNLWALSFGNGGNGGSPNTLYFTAGPGGTDGLFGALSVPEPNSAVLGLIAMGLVATGLTWNNRRRQGIA